MIGPNPLLLDMEPLNWILRDADGDVRAALICWSVAIGGFVVLRIPRQVLLGCLVAGAATVGLAATVVEAVPAQATVAVSRTIPASHRAPASARVPHIAVTEQGRPH